MMRIMLFLATNLAVLIIASITLKLLGVDRFAHVRGAIGYALAGPCGLPHADVKPEDGELKRLYLLKSAQNGGVGAALFEQALAWLAELNVHAVWDTQRYYAVAWLKADQTEQAAPADQLLQQH